MWAEPGERERSSNVGPADTRCDWSLWLVAETSDRKAVSCSPTFWLRFVLRFVGETSEADICEDIFAKTGELDRSILEAPFDPDILWLVACICEREDGERTLSQLCESRFWHGVESAPSAG